MTQPRAMADANAAASSSEGAGVGKRRTIDWISVWASPNSRAARSIARYLDAGLVKGPSGSSRSIPALYPAAAVFYPPTCAEGLDLHRSRARSSVGERSLHTREVAGSKPAVPISRNPFRDAESRFLSQSSSDAQRTQNLRHR